jgi:hypothetical protein
MTEPNTGLVRTLSGACLLPHWDPGSPSSRVPAFLLARSKINSQSVSPRRRLWRPRVAGVAVVQVCACAVLTLCSMLTDPRAGSHTGTRAHPPRASLQFCSRCPRSICFATQSPYPMAPKRWGAPRLRGGRGRVPGAGGVSVCAKRVCAHQPSVGRGRRRAGRRMVSVVQRRAHTLCSMLTDLRLRGRCVCRGLS